MAKAKQPILLIDQADMPSLAATMIQPDPARLILWHLRGDDERASRCSAIVSEHAEILDSARVIVSDAWTSGVEQRADAGGLEDGLMLTQAAIVARQLGASKIIWPVQVGPIASLVSQAADSAATVGDLAETASVQPGGALHGEELIIDLPLVDLADEQVLDLVDDCGAPLRAFWPCERGGNEPCGVCGGCLRWLEAFRTGGLAWPWSSVKA